MKFIAVTAALILAPLATHAADLDLRKSYPPETPAPAKATWTGAYAGVNGGWGWGTVTDRYVTPVLGDIKTKGALGGFQVGYNHQVGNVVLGAEADFDLGRVHGQISTSLNDVTVGQYRVSGAGRASSSLSSFGTIRLRSGYTLGPALLYVTGGYAYGRNQIKASGSMTYTLNGVPASASDAGDVTKTMNGWAIGAGVEYAFAANLSGRVEFLHADLGKTKVFERSWAETEVANSLNLVRAGVNYRF